MHDHPPVAELVAESFNDDGVVVGQLAGRLSLFGQVGKQVRRRPVVEPRLEQPRVCCCARQRRELANECAQRAPELERPALRVAVPEGQLARHAGCGNDEHLIVGDFDDAPRRRAEGEHLADARFVDHLLVELANASRGPVTRQEDAEQAAVGDRAAAGDGEPLRAGSAGDGARDAVPHQPWPQFGELVARIAAGQHVEHCVEGRLRKRREGCCSSNQRKRVVDVPRLHRGHRDEMLREHVERVARNANRLDRADLHPFGDDSGLHKIAAILRKDDAPRHRAHLMAGPADALQPAGHTRRALDLHDEVNRAHVDAEFERAGGHDRGQLP